MHSDALPNEIKKMSRATRVLQIDCKAHQKDDLQAALLAFPNLEKVKLQEVRFPLGDLQIPSTLKKLKIASSTIQLPALEILSGYHGLHSEVVLRPIERWPTNPFLPLFFFHFLIMGFFSMHRVQDMNLTRLDLNLDNLSMEVTRALCSRIENLPYLEFFSWRMANLPTGFVEGANQLATLRSRSITQLIFTFYEEFFKLRLEMPQLTTLNVENSYQEMVTNEFLEHLALHSPQLANFSFGPDPDTFFSSRLKLFPRLSNLYVVEGEISEPIDTIFPPSTTQLDLANVNFDQSGIGSMLSSLPNLHELTLSPLVPVSSLDGWFSSSVQHLKMASIVKEEALAIAAYFPEIRTVRRPPPKKLSFSQHVYHST